MKPDLLRGSIGTLRKNPSSANIKMEPILLSENQGRYKVRTTKTAASHPFLILMLLQQKQYEAAYTFMSIKTTSLKSLQLHTFIIRRPYRNSIGGSTQSSLKDFLTYCKDIYSHPKKTQFTFHSKNRLLSNFIRSRSPYYKIVLSILHVAAIEMRTSESWKKFAINAVQTLNKVVARRWL